ncbi:MAG: hypothetical protein BGN88_13520 [Clostridiales bacterium 43-6]|nr:MAG: hypothetical protein BGN88_13520 [Clostridiales bacterium 43-6]
MIKKLLFFLEFPQNLIGFIVSKLYRKSPYHFYRDARVTLIKGSWGAISLSKYIFTDENYYNTPVELHEYGHTLQSKKLLFLFGFVIAIPSLIWAGCFERYREKHHVSYDSFYTEKWANELGNYQEE